MSSFTTVPINIFISLDSLQASSILLTLPTPDHSKMIPAKFETELPAQEEGTVTFVFLNNGYITKKQLLKEPTEYIKYLKKAEPEFFAKLKTWPKEDVWNLVVRVLETVRETLPISQMKAAQRSAYLTCDRKYDSQATPRLISVIINGQRIGLDRGKFLVAQALAPLLDDQLPCKYKGAFLYRSPTSHEWDRIKTDKVFLIKQGDNFEKEVGPQVLPDQNQEHYAGVIIRIPNKRPYNQLEVLPVPCISPILPHFIAEDEIFVSKTGAADSFIPLKEFLAKE